MSSLPVVIVEEQPAQKPESRYRYYFYDAEFRISVAMDITTEGEILVALTACRTEDTFIKHDTSLDRRREAAGFMGRRNARRNLDGRLALQYLLMETGGSDRSNRNKFVVRFSHTYKGDKPLRDVWFPFIDSLRKYVHETFGTPYQKDVLDAKGNRTGETQLAFKLEKERNISYIMHGIRQWAEAFEPEDSRTDEEMLAETASATTAPS